MPRLPRIHIEGSLYYITCQSHHSNELFEDSQDYNKYLDLLTIYRNKYQFKLFSYCLLSNKVYLLVGIESESSISEIMFNLNSSYTKYYNTRHGKKGSVLNGRFKSKWVEKKTYLLPLTRYIHLLSEEKDYSHNSYSAFLGKPSHIPIADEIQEVSSYLSINTDYKTYVDKVTPNELKDFKQKLARNRFLGSPEFHKTIETALKAYQENKENRTSIPADITKEKSKIVLSRHIPTSLLLGSVSFVVLFLIFTSYFYNRQLFLKKELNITKEKFSQESTELNKTQVQPPALNSSQIVEKPKELVSGEKAKVISHPLEGIVLEVKLGSVSTENSQVTRTDMLSFKEGKFVSSILTKEGFSPSKYSMRYKGEGVIVWETMQTKEDGTTANWYGEWKDNTMKGVLSERLTNGKNRDFSFVSIGRNREG